MYPPRDGRARSGSNEHGAVDAGHGQHVRPRDDDGGQRTLECRSPISSLFAHWRTGVGGAFRMGTEHGAFCLGCCWFR
ncbi:MAG: DUF2182 domain-containing protein [Longimicrobiales bacterium]